jgi:hypothetical protein
LTFETSLKWKNFEEYFLELRIYVDTIEPWVTETKKSVQWGTVE